MILFWQTDWDLRLACLLLYAFDCKDKFWTLYGDFLPSADDCSSLLLAPEVREQRLQQNVNALLLTQTYLAFLGVLLCPSMQACLKTVDSGCTRWSTMFLMLVFQMDSGAQFRNVGEVLTSYISVYFIAFKYLLTFACLGWKRLH